MDVECGRLGVSARWQVDLCCSRDRIDRCQEDLLFYSTAVKQCVKPALNGYRMKPPLRVPTPAKNLLVADDQRAVGLRSFDFFELPPSNVSSTRHPSPCLGVKKVLFL